jgi:hypothetical protein
MKLYRHWALGESNVRSGKQSWTLRAYGGSNASLEDAKQRAREIAERAAAAVSAGRPPGEYLYSERALREEIIEEFVENGEPVAAITRNSYGSLVLNTSRVMFADVDYPPSQTTSPAKAAAGLAGRLLRRLTGSPRPAEAAAPPSRDDGFLERFHNVSRANGDIGMRVYRTAAGFRLLVTSQLLEPMSSAAHELLNSFGSDALYQRLCSAQVCFRARLTPKYWRCGSEKPPSRFPWASAEEEARYREWEKAYAASAEQFATCAYVANFGDAHVDPAVQPMLDLHDRMTIQEGAPLA